MSNGKQKERADVGNVARRVFGEGEIIEINGKKERVYTVGSGKGEVPLSFLFRYSGNEYKVGDRVPEDVVVKAIERYRASKNPKSLEKELSKDIAEMRKADSLGKGTLGFEAGAQVGIPVKAEDREAKGIEKGGGRIGVQRTEKYGKTWGGEFSYTSAGAYGGTVSYADLFISAATDKWKVGMGGPLEFGLMSGDIEDVVLMRGLERPWNIKVDWKKTGAWVRPYFGLNYGPWYFLYNPVTRGFYGGFNVWGGIISYAQTAFSKGMNECEGCGTGKKVFAGLGELIGLSSGIREGTRAWKRSKGNWFQRFFYSIGHFFKGMFASIGYVGLQVGIVQPWRLFVNSLYRFVFRAKTPKDAKTREFTPEEIEKMRQKVERELGEGMIDKAKDDVDMWLKYEKLPPEFRGYLMSMRDRIDIMGAYVGLPFTLFPPGWKKSRAKKRIEENTRKAIEEIKQGKNVEQNTAYLSAKLGGVNKTSASGREIFEEFSPCVVPKDELAGAVSEGIDKLTGKINSWREEIKNGKYDNAYRLTCLNDILTGNLGNIPPEYSYLQIEAQTSGIGRPQDPVLIKASYYSEKQEIGERVDSELELQSIIGAYAMAYYSNVLNEEEAENESKYINGLINQDKKMAAHLFLRMMDRVEEAAKEWRKAMEERNMDKAREYESALAYYNAASSILYEGMPSELQDKIFKEHYPKITYLAIVNPQEIPRAELLKYHPEFKKALEGSETADVKQMKTNLKKSIGEMRNAIDAGDHEQAKKIWEEIAPYMQRIDQEKANKMNELLAKARWSEEDKLTMKSHLRYFAASL
ncbi:MAG: hypothetical protein QXY61_00810 [Candidatus Anstonellales archaeon]